MATVDRRRAGESLQRRRTSGSVTWRASARGVRPSPARRQRRSGEARAELADEVALTGGPRKSDPAHPGEPPMGVEGFRQPVHQPRSPEWIEPLLPPQVDDPDDACLAVDAWLDAAHQ